MQFNKWDQLIGIHKKSINYWDTQLFLQSNELGAYLKIFQQGVPQDDYSKTTSWRADWEKDDFIEINCSSSWGIIIPEQWANLNEIEFQRTDWTDVK